MSEQHKALKLADEVDEVALVFPDMAEVSAELRRQHAEIERLNTEAVAADIRIENDKLECQRIYAVLDSHSAITQKAEAERDAATKCANTLYRHCVSLMESGRDRIIAEGGQCDSVEVMERSDPWLTEARKLLKGEQP